MFDPNAYPYFAAFSYTDDLAPPVLSNVFYNPTQDHLARLFGGALGRSASIQTEEFDLEAAGLAGVGETFGEQLRIQTATNTEALSVAAIAAGDHGVWKAQNAAGGASEFIARDAEKYIDTRQFIWCMRVRVTNRANLETAANSGFLIGMGPLVAAAPDLPCFYVGSDTANWQLGANGAGFDSGVACTDNTWYWLIITRISDGTISFHIGTGFTTPIDVIQTIAWGAALTSCRRFVRMVGGGGQGAGEGFYIDHFSRGIER